MDWMALLRCFIYLVALGVASQIIGTALPRRWFDGTGFLFACRSFEKNGKIYEKLGIKYWKDKLPDMSKLMKKSMTPKQIKEPATVERVTALLKETCVAELVHLWLIVLAFPCIFLWKGVGGWTVWALYILGNIPFVLIQRYNRPRFSAVAAALEKRKNATKIHR